MVVDNEKFCLVACDVLEPELQHLVKGGKLDVELVFVSKNFHVDYSLIEKNVRNALEDVLKRYPGRVVLVYGDLCLGTDNEMVRLAEEYNVVKIDALNCVDCQLGKGKVEVIDPEHKLMFMGVGMIEFFKYAKAQLVEQGVDDDVFKKMFSGIDGFVILDTVGTSEECKCELEKLGMGVSVIETCKIGVENVYRVVMDAIEKSKKR